MSGNAKQRVTLSNLNEPQQMRELNRQLTWIWDQLLGGLSMKSLNEGTQAVINSKAESAELNELGETVARHSTQFEQTEKLISLKADQETVNALSGEVTKNSAELKVTAELISSKADKTAVDSLSGTVSEHSARFDVTAEQIASKADKSVVNELGETVESHSSAIEQTAERIGQTVTAVEKLDERVEKNESEVFQTADLIAAEVRRATKAEGELSSRMEASAEEILLEVSRKANAGDPAAGVDTGKSSSVRVKITKDAFDVNVPGEDGDFMLNEAGGRLQVLDIGKSLSAPNVARQYDGPGTIYVNPNATSAQIAAGNYVRSLADALAMLDKRWVGKNVTIRMAAGMTEYGALNLTGVSGGCWINIAGDSENRAKLVGQLNLNYCASPVRVKDLKVDTDSIGVNFEGCGAAEVSACIITGPGVSVSGTRGINASRGSNLYVYGCELYDCERSLYGSAGGTISGYNCKGNCRVGANRTNIYLDGTMPCDSTEWAAAEWAGKVFAQNVTVDQGSRPTPETAPTTAVYSYQHTDSYTTGWSAFSDEDVRQGYNGHRIYGVIWFDAAAIRSALSGRTIRQASLRLHMHKGIGRGAAVSVQLYGTDKAYSGRTGAPALVSDYGTIGMTNPGEISEITIPVQAVSDIVSGKTCALVLYSSDTGYYKDRDYSQNYARFSGSTSATAENGPRLTVVYQ